MIRACPRAPGVAPGGALRLHVATGRPRFRVAFYRWANGPQLMRRSAWLPGAAAAELEKDGAKRSFDMARDRGAALGLFQRNGTLIAAGSTDWPQVPACTRDRRIERITRNVFDRLLHA